MPFEQCRSPHLCFLNSCYLILIVSYDPIYMLRLYILYNHIQRDDAIRRRTGIPSVHPGKTSEADGCGCYTAAQSQRREPRYYPCWKYWRNEETHRQNISIERGEDVMSAVISVRVNDKEKEMLKKASEVYGCAVSTLMKNLAFEKLRDEYDLQVVAEYEKQKNDGTLKTRPVDELWKELGL